MYSYLNNYFLPSRLRELEKFYLSILRSFLKVHAKIANYILYLEFGCLNVSTLVVLRFIKFCLVP